MPFSTNPKRDAKRTFAGYIYQVNMSILRWLSLRADEHLELEAGEDIDLVRHSLVAGDKEKERIMEQLKQVSRSITLRSADALEAIANFCEHRTENPTETLRFRFLTTAAVGKERGPWTGSIPAIEDWEELRTQDVATTEKVARLERLRAYLRNCPKPEALSSTVWQSLLDVLSAPELAPFEAIVNNFEWATESGDHQAIEAAICGELQGRDPERSEANAKVQYRNLFGFVIKLLTQDGTKKLTDAQLSSELAATSLTLDDQLSAMQLRSWIDTIDAKLENHETRIEALEARSSGTSIKTFFVLDETKTRSGLLFDFNQTLRGRKRRLDELNAFLADPKRRIAILPGRGGIGKTKLLRDWSMNTSAFHPLWVNPYGTWTENSGGEIPNSDSVLIADDAHRYSDLEKLVSYVSSEEGGAKLKLVIATRPSGQSFVNDIIARASDEDLVMRFDPLHEPGPNATLEIAKEVLGASFEHLAEALTHLSKDTPLVTVVGGRLIAREQIRPELLANDQDFRNAVFQKFAEECEGYLPAGRAQRRELLQLIAAVQPVIDQDDRFADRASAFLALRPDQVWQGLDDVENRGVLLRGRGGVRITPDLFGDFLLESASVNNHGAATGFADTVFEWFEETHLSNLLKNFAELDWRITQRDPDSQLLSRIWASIYQRFRAQDAAQRLHFLRDVQGIAGFQPNRVEELVRIAMDEPAEPGREWLFGRPREQKDVLEEIPSLLGATIFHEPNSSDAFGRLWSLSQQASDRVHDPARKALKDAIGYHKYKDPIYNERILGLVEGIAAEASSYRGDFTTLSLVDELMEREVEDNRLRGRAFSISFLSLNYPALQTIRDRALQIIERTLYSEAPRAAVRAARSCAKVISEFHPRLRSGATEHENQWQDTERLAALSVIENRIVAGELSLPLNWKLDRLLGYVDRRDAQSAQVKERAAAVRALLPKPDRLELFDVLVTDEYEDALLEDNHITIPQSRRDQEERALNILQNSHPGVNDRIDTIEKLAQEAADAGIEPLSLGNVLQRLCHDPAFLKAVTEYALNEPNSILARLAQVPLSHWRSVAPAEYARFGSAFASSPNFLLAASVAIGVSYGPAIENPIPEDVTILTILASRSEGRVLGPVLFGLKRLVPKPQYAAAALELYVHMQVGNDHHLAKEYCGFAGTYGISPTVLNSTLVERMLANLVEVAELDSDAFGGLMARTCRIAPLAFVQFFEKRILRRLSLGKIDEYSDYEAIPSSFSWSTLSGAVEPNVYAEAVDEFLALIQRYPGFAYMLTQIFWHLASMDEVTMVALDRLLHDPEDSGPALVNDIVREGPKGIAFSHPMFAMHVLSECADRGPELEADARSTLFSNSLHSGGFQVSVRRTPQQPNNSDTSPANALSAQWAAGSLPQRFYFDLANARRLPIPSPDLSEFNDEDDDDSLPSSSPGEP